MCAIVSLFTDIFILFYKKRLARSHFFAGHWQLMKIMPNSFFFRGIRTAFHKC